MPLWGRGRGGKRKRLPTLTAYITINVTPQSPGQILHCEKALLRYMEKIWQPGSTVWPVACGNSWVIVSRQRERSYNNIPVNYTDEEFTGSIWIPADADWLKTYEQKLDTHEVTELSESWLGWHGFGGSHTVWTIAETADHCLPSPKKTSLAFREVRMMPFLECQYLSFHQWFPVYAFDTNIVRVADWEEGFQSI